MPGECQAQVAELEQELEHGDQLVTEAMKDYKQKEMELERLWKTCSNVLMRSANAIGRSESEMQLPLTS